VFVAGYTNEERAFGLADHGQFQHRLIIGDYVIHHDVVTFIGKARGQEGELAIHLAPKGTQ